MTVTSFIVVAQATTLIGFFLPTFIATVAETKVAVRRIRVRVRFGLILWSSLLASHHLHRVSYVYMQTNQRA